MKFTIDRFEGEYAVVELEDMEMIDIPVKILPLGAKEGDIIDTSIDYDKTKARKKRIEDKFNSLIMEDSD